MLSHFQKLGIASAPVKSKNTNSLQVVMLVYLQFRSSNFKLFLKHAVKPALYYQKVSCFLTPGLDTFVQHAAMDMEQNTQSIFKDSRISRKLHVSLKAPHENLADRSYLLTHHTKCPKRRIPYGKQICWILEF